MREYYEVLKRVDRGEKGAVRAYRTHKNEYYKLGETCGAGDIFLEPPSVPDVNTGEIEPQDYFLKADANPAVSMMHSMRSWYCSQSLQTAGSDRR